MRPYVPLVCGPWLLIGDVYQPLHASDAGDRGGNNRVQVRGDDAITGPERLEALRIIETRIARAGVRLAAVLNRAMALATGTR